MSTTYRPFERMPVEPGLFQAPAMPWLVSLRHRREARLRMICFPYAGGGASVFGSWPDQLPPAIDLRSLQLPGREMRFAEDAMTDLGALVDIVAGEISAAPDLPVAFFGHSLGALIAFEVARELRARGGPAPVHLFVSAYVAPQLRKTERPIHLLPDNEFLAEIADLNGTPAGALENRELMQLVLPSLRADFELHWSYEHKRQDPLDCPITAFGGLSDPHVGLDDLEAWGEHTRGRFSVKQFPGDHFFLHAARPLLLWSVCQQLRTLLQ